MAEILKIIPELCSITYSCMKSVCYCMTLVPSDCIAISILLAEFLPYMPLHAVTEHCALVRYFISSP